MECQHQLQSKQEWSTAVLNGPCMQVLVACFAKSMQERDSFQFQVNLQLYFLSDLFPSSDCYASVSDCNTIGSFSFSWFLIKMTRVLSPHDHVNKIQLPSEMF